MVEYNKTINEVLKIKINIKIKDKKKFVITTSIIVLALLLVIIGIYFTFSGGTKQTISDQFEDEGNRIAEEPIDEYVDINELENENIVDENIDEEQNNVKNKTTTNNTKVPTGTTPYYIKVNYGAQVVTIYSKDESGNYTVPVKAMICSTGTYTPKSGVYSIPARWTWLGLQGNVYGHYCTQIKGNILFHSVPYLRRGDNASLEYWEYDKLGTYASAGCVRLLVKDAKWIFDNCAKGTKVEFYSDSNPGQLGKPSAKKISSYPDYLRNWDPTDPDSNNPWRTYKEPTNEKENIVENKVINNTITNQTHNTEINEIASNVIINETIDNNIVTNEEKNNSSTNNTTNTVNNIIQNKENTTTDIITTNEMVNEQV